MNIKDPCTVWWKHGIRVILASMNWSLLAFLIACNTAEDREPNICEDRRVPDTYVYPIVPGTQEWADLGTTEARFAACQIPSERLKVISTAGLVDSWREFPFAMDLFFADNFQAGIDFFLENFSGLQELSRRQDAGVVLMMTYENMKPACVVGYKDGLEKGAFTLDFVPVELLLAQEFVLDKLTLSEKKALLSETLLKYRGKRKYHEEFGMVTGTAMSLFVIARILEDSDYLPFMEELRTEELSIMTLFLDTGVLYLTDPEAGEIINLVMHAEDFLEQRQ